MSSLETAINSSTAVVGQRFDGDDMEAFSIGEVEFRGCRFSKCRFDEATLRAVKFIDCSFDHCSFRETIFIDCQFAEGDTGSEWRYSDLSKAEFRKCNLALNRLVGCTAYLADFNDCACPGIKIDAEVQRKVRTQVIPGGLRFVRCKMQYAEFSPSDLRESVFEGSDLRDCSLVGCTLDHASFRGSSLNNIDFTGSTLDHADLSHATFDKLDFETIASFHALTVSRDQHEAIVTSFGLLTVG